MCPSRGGTIRRASDWTGGGGRARTRPLIAGGVDPAVSTTKVDRAKLFALVGQREKAVRAFLRWARDAEQEALDAGKPRMMVAPVSRRARISATQERQPGASRNAGGASSSSPRSVPRSGRKPSRTPSSGRSLKSRPGERSTRINSCLIAGRPSPDSARLQRREKGARGGLSPSRVLPRCPPRQGRDVRGPLLADQDHRLPQWGRTTTFDLLLRAGALAVGGKKYGPTIAHLAGSTGPKSGFKRVWGQEITRENADWGESLLRAWTENWFEVAKRVGVDWDVGAPYDPGAFENALCVYQERRHSSASRC